MHKIHNQQKTNIKLPEKYGFRVSSLLLPEDKYRVPNVQLLGLFMYIENTSSSQIHASQAQNTKSPQSFFKS